ncbi:MAG: hypothetical protein IPM51_08750 [Sphingobacteriaceae bacterium]|nr:hypothetical protein [Sphingobacteriaceae bacterium]
MQSERRLELACFNIESAIIAEKAGAHRIEFAKNYLVGGLSPTQQEIAEVRDKIKIPIHVLLRPHANHFQYSDSEKIQMIKDIRFCKKIGINGIVFGALTKNNLIDEDFCKKLIAESSGLHIVFHRAIDKTSDIFNAVQLLINLGFHSVLTSGAQFTAINGIPALEKLHFQFGTQINIIPGGEIRASQFPELLKTNCKEFHSAALSKGESICNQKEIEQLLQKIRS